MKFVKSLAFVALLALMVSGSVLAYPALTQADTAALQAAYSQPANNSTYAVSQNINFSASANGGASPYAYVWNFGDGVTRFGQTQSHAYSSSGSKTVTLTVTDFQGRTSNATINLTITGSGTNTGNRPVISNVRAINITQTGVTILWDTDIAATSRVIFDTNSHTDISTQSAPNFGYAASTDTYDSAPKVTAHSVNITGLNPNTRYYFRVISE